MNKLNFVIVGILVVFCLSGCAKVEKTETISVQAKIVDTYHSGMWLQPVRSGNVTTWNINAKAKKIIPSDIKKLKLNIKPIKNKGIAALVPIFAIGTNEFLNLKGA